MRFGSVCSGIEAASVAWPFWEAAWFSEIEPFPCAVLKHHYPDVPNHGDMTTLPDRILSGEVEAPDVFCGGTPCQAFSVAGNRKSLDDARGNLSLTFCEIADAIDTVRYVRGSEPAIIFWENVPGVLNTTDNAFGCFLGELAGETMPLQPPGGRWTDAGCVFGPKRAIAWRVLDAQYFGLAQRRRRVFLCAVKHGSRKGFNPSEVLFEFDSLRRDTAPSRQAGQGITADAETGPVANRMIEFGEYVADDTASTLKMRDYKDATDLICAEISPTVSPPHVFKIRGGCEGGGKGYLGQDEQAFTITTGHDQQVAVPLAIATKQIGQNIEYDIANTLAANDYKEPQAVATPLVGVPIDYDQQVAVGIDLYNCTITGDLAATLSTRNGIPDATGPRVMTSYGVPVAYSSARGIVRELPDIMATLDAARESRGTNQQRFIMQPTANQYAVRRLTPIECERLQGFPDNYTNIPWRKKPESPDGPRYKALGNSWAVPVVRWIGERINNVTNVTK